MSPRRDVGDAQLPDRVPGLALVEAERLHRRRRREQGPEGYTGGNVALVRPVAATTRTAPGREPRAADRVTEA